jgi:hypothetical protein
MSGALTSPPNCVLDGGLGPMHVAMVMPGLLHIDGVTQSGAETYGVGADIAQRSDGSWIVQGPVRIIRTGWHDSTDVPAQVRAGIEGALAAGVRLWRADLVHAA